MTYSIINSVLKCMNPSEKVILHFPEEDFEFTVIELLIIMDDPEVFDEYMIYSITTRHAALEISLIEYSALI